MRSLLLALGLAGLATSAAAQGPARIGVNTVFSIDEFGGQTTTSGQATDRPNIIADITLTARLSERWQFYVRPWFRQPRTPDWDKQIYQAAFRYERPGPIMMRLDAGYIASPIGLGMLDAQADLNPFILPHLSYLIPMPSIDSGAPRMTPIAATYPLGAVLTVSTDQWDARAAVVSSTPTRGFVINGATNPRATPVFEAGAGVTPRAGVRIGVSFARGQYATSDESSGPVDRTLTLVGVEGEYAFNHTKVSGEFVADGFSTSGGTARSYTWFVQGMQTLTPRWFVAAREEGTSAPPLGARARTDFENIEATAGFRVTPELTLRSSYYRRHLYIPATWDHQAGVSVVWAHRWW